MRILCVSFALTGMLSAAVAHATAERGRELLQRQGCAACHDIGPGSSTVSTGALRRTLNREYSPAGLTATMWNHAPEMWAAMASAGVPVPRISEEHAGNLFAYFASLRYFEPMGDASRGKR